MAKLNPVTKKLIKMASAGDNEEFIQLYMREYGVTRDVAAATIGGFSRLDADEGVDNAGGKKSHSEGLGFIEKMLNTQEVGAKNDGGEFLTAQKGIKSFFNESGEFRGVMGSIGNIITDQIVIGLDQSTQLLTEMNDEVGMTGQLSKDFREEIMAASPAVLRLGISFDSLKTSVSSILQESGKFKLLGQETIEELARTSVFTESLEDMAGMAKGFEDIGYGVSDMTELIDNAGHSSLELGLRAKNITKGVSENLDKINQYGFKDGVEGLTKMVQQSVEFRMNMDEVFKVAEKVWDPDGALEMVSNLQVIGGAIGDLNDPIKLMYMATNDVEGLQDAIQGAAKSLVTYNDEQGRFEITGANLRKAKEMAKTLGIEMGELTKTAVAGMERTQAASELLSRGIDFKDGDMEFLTNLAQMKDGKMTIELPEDLQKQLGKESVNLSEISQEQTQALIDNREAFKKLSTEDITRSQFKVIQNIAHDLTFIAAKARVGISKELGDTIEKFIAADAGKSLSDLSYKGFNKLGEDVDNLQVQYSEIVAKSTAGPFFGGKPVSKTMDTKGYVPPETKTVTKTEEKSNNSESNNSITKKVQLEIVTNTNIVKDLTRSMLNDKNFMNSAKHDYLKSLQPK